MRVLNRLVAALIIGIGAAALGCSYDYEAATRCSNGVKDGDESDVDCGAACVREGANANDGRCAFGKLCNDANDCDSQASCAEGRCRPQTFIAKWRRIIKDDPPSRLGARLSFQGEYGFLTGGYQKEKNIPGHALQEMYVFDGKVGAKTWRSFGMDAAGRFYHAQAFDPTLNAVIVAGGIAGSTRLKDTWAIVNAQEWKHVGDLPVTRVGAAMVYAKDRMVFYGEATPNEIWTRAGELTSDWAPVKTAQAPAVAPYHHAMAYDAAHDKLLVFGGCLGPCDTETTARTMTLDLSVSPPKWEPVTANGPIALFGSAMAYDPNRKRIVLFGGRSGDDTRYNDTYEWDGSNWSLMQPLDATVPGETMPTPSFQSAIAYDSERRQMLLMSGGVHGYNTISETWAYTVLGWPCASDAECGVSNLCVDNVCCDEKCSEGCNDRNHPGICRSEL